MLVIEAMKIINTVVKLSACIAITLCLQAYGDSYTFTFTGGGVSASGMFDETGGLVTSGSMVISGAAYNGSFDLAAPPHVRALDGTDIIFDNAFPLTGGGLGFGSGFIDAAHYDYVANIWYNGPGSYTLFEAGQLPDGTGHVYNGYDGTFSASAVPDGGASLLLLGLAMLVLATFKRLTSRRASQVG